MHIRRQSTSQYKRTYTRVITENPPSSGHRTTENCRDTEALTQTQNVLFEGCFDQAGI